MEMRWSINISEVRSIDFLKKVIDNAATLLNLSVAEVVPKCIDNQNRDKFIKKSLEIFFEGSQKDQEWILSVFKDAAIEPTDEHLYVALNHAYNSQVVFDKRRSKPQFNVLPLVTEAKRRNVAFTDEDHIIVYLARITEETDNYKQLLKLRDDYYTVSKSLGGEPLSDQRGTFIENYTKGIAKFFRTDVIEDRAKSLVKLVDNAEAPLNWENEKMRTAVRSFILACLKSLSANGYPTEGFNYFNKAIETCRGKIPAIVEILNEPTVQRVARLIYQEILEDLGYKIIYSNEDEIKTWANIFGIDDWRERMQHKILETADDMAGKIINVKDFLPIFITILEKLPAENRKKVFERYYTNLLTRNDPNEIIQIAEKLSRLLDNLPDLLTTEQKKFFALALYNALLANDPNSFIDSADALLLETERPHDLYLEYLRSLK